MEIKDIIAARHDVEKRIMSLEDEHQANLRKLQRELQ
jgi:hypothetical protein